MAEYIDRDAIYKAFANACTDVLERASEIDYIAGFSYELVIEILDNIPTVDVAPVVHGRCPICSGRKILTQDCDNGYSVEVDAEQGEMSIWQGDTCLTVISIDYCPNCGAKMDGGEDE